MKFSTLSKEVHLDHNVEKKNLLMAELSGHLCRYRDSKKRPHIFIKYMRLNAAASLEK
jgi:hypothetical protein